VSGELTHLDSTGAARMVDVTAKDVTARTASATGRVRVSAEVVALLRGGGVPKGDALAVARIAGIMGAKKVPDLVPLCHPIALHGVEVTLTVADDASRSPPPAAPPTDRRRDGGAHRGVRRRARARRHGQGRRPGRRHRDVRVETKTGGASGDWRRPGDA
jgi:cyclic pyranopterin phosphate synthase